jgi:outer membrane lipoprotein carrier protein
MNRILLLGALLFLSVADTGQADTQSARAQLERFSAQLETLHAQFEQRVIGTDGVIGDNSSGEVWLRRPGLFRWEYGGDFPEVVVADGKNIWIYDEVLEQVTVKDQTQVAMNSPLVLLIDLGQLDEQFEVREAGASDQWLLLELRSRSAESDFERILLGLNEDSLQLMVMEDAFGLRTEINFVGVERNPELEPGLFTFVPPDSVDVIGEIQR